jgi:hypothetical protein
LFFKDGNKDKKDGNAVIGIVALVILDQKVPFIKFNDPVLAFIYHE